MDEDRKRIYDTIKYEFNDDSILKEALSPPYPSKQLSGKDMIEFKRLKWLGDSILDMVVTDQLYKLFPEDSEGELSRKKGRLVSANTLHEIAERIRVMEFIYKDPHCQSSSSTKYISDTIEAIIGAIYVDGGIENVKKFISYYWESLMKGSTVNSNESEWDPISYLKIWSEKKKSPLPKYEVIKISGPSHNPSFKVKACLEHVGEAYGNGNTKREAERNAAKVLYDRLCSPAEESRRDGGEIGGTVLN